MLFIACVMVAFGTGGMVGPAGHPHQYWSGSARAFGRSPKTALRQARKLAEQKCGEGSAWCMVFHAESVREAVTGRVVYEE